MNASADRIQLTPPASRSLTLMWMLIGLGPVLATLATLSVDQHEGQMHLALPWLGGPVEQRMLLLIGCIWAGFAVIGYILARLMHRQRVELQGSRLTITSSLHRCRIEAAELSLPRARIVDLDEHTELKPILKRNGLGVPGYRSGWFYLRNRRRCFVATSDSAKVLWLPGLGKHDLLLDVRDPKALLEQLRELAGKGHAH
jgi:hypothetical protein